MQSKRFIELHILAHQHSFPYRSLNINALLHCTPTVILIPECCRNQKCGHSRRFQIEQYSIFMGKSWPNIRFHSVKSQILLWCKPVSLRPPEKSVYVTSSPLNHSQHLPKLESNLAVFICCNKPFAFLSICLQRRKSFNV